MDNKTMKTENVEYRIGDGIASPGNRSNWETTGHAVVRSDGTACVQAYNTEDCMADLIDIEVQAALIYRRAIS